MILLILSWYIILLLITIKVNSRYREYVNTRYTNISYDETLNIIHFIVLYKIGNDIVTSNE